MSSAAKAKGYRWESAIRAYLLERGFHDARRILQDGYVGLADVEFTGPPPFSVQAKDWKSIASALAEGVDGAVRQTGPGRHPVAFIKRRGKAAAEGYAVLRITDFLDLLQEMSDATDRVRPPAPEHGGTRVPDQRVQLDWWRQHPQPGPQAGSDRGQG